MDFDFASIDTKTRADAGVPMPVLRLDGTPLTDRDGNAVTITVLGADSDRYRAMTRAQVKRRLERLADSSGKPTAGDVEAADAESLDVLVAVTTGWENVRTPEGSPIDCTPDAARALYTRYPVIAEQVDRFVGRRENFLLASSGN